MKKNSYIIPFIVSICFFLVSFFAGLLFVNNLFAAKEFAMGTMMPVSNFVAIDNIFIRILTNNLFASFILITGNFVLGLTTFINLLFTGYTFGASISLALSNGAPIRELILLTLPHGILELPAIIISGAIGFKVPVNLFTYFGGRRSSIINMNEIKYTGYLIVILLVMLIIAAFIEAVFVIPYSQTL
ncbi:MAG: stage II sporulation protein M [Syntrophaceticus sp.]